MKTDDLILSLAADNGQKGPRLNTVWAVCGLASVVLAALVFFSTIGPRLDFAQAVQTVRFDFKFVLTIALAVTAFACLRALSVPGKPLPAWPLLAIAPAMALMAVLAELVALPPEAWPMAAQGKNAFVCLTFIPLIGVGPLVIFAIGARKGAPTRPVLTGAITGLVAGAISATLYAAHCTDDSPLFVMTWYPLAIGIVTAAGALIGRFLLRW